MLNKDQINAKNYIRRWWMSAENYMVLEGRAGTGKTFLVLEAIKDLYGCVPLITAPSNEATRQLQNVLGDKYPLKTTYSALGYGFDTRKEHIDIKQIRLPAELENYNLIVVDEASFIGDDLLRAILSTKIKVLFIGHRSQLPQVKTDLSLTDKCVSPAFEKGYLTYTLKTPVRNTGDLYSFCNHLEELIYKPPVAINRDYDIFSKRAAKFIKSNSNEFLKENIKYLGWTNALVDKVNTTIRQYVFKSSAKEPLLREDRIIITKPAQFVGEIDRLSEKTLLKMIGQGIRLTANSKFTINKVAATVILNVPCHAVYTKYDEQDVILYIPKNKESLNRLYKKYLYAAYSMKSTSGKGNAFKRLHYVMSLFSEVKHAYALTTHRAQGMSIPKVMVDVGDIRKCRNTTLSAKMLYVAASRASTDLMLVRS